MEIDTIMKYLLYMFYFVDLKLTDCHYSSVCNRLLPVSSKWCDLALELGVSLNDTDKIKIENANDCDNCLKAMLKQLLRSGKLLSWKVIITALRQPAVKEGSHADDLEGQLSMENDRLSKINMTEQGGRELHGGIVDSVVSEGQCTVPHPCFSHQSSTLERKKKNNPRRGSLMERLRTICHRNPQEASRQRSGSFETKREQDHKKRALQRTRYASRRKREVKKEAPPECEGSTKGEENKTDEDMQCHCVSDEHDFCSISVNIFHRNQNQAMDSKNGLSVCKFPPVTRHHAQTFATGSASLNTESLSMEHQQLRQPLGVCNDKLIIEGEKELYTCSLKRLKKIAISGKDTIMYAILPVKKFTCIGYS